MGGSGRKREKKSVYMKVSRNDSYSTFILSSATRLRPIPSHHCTILSVSAINVSLSTALVVYISKRAFDRSSSLENSRAKILQASERSVEMVANRFRGEIVLEDVEFVKVSALLHYSEEGSQKMYLLTSVLTNTRSVKLQR